jgi:hypothetical protein
MIEYFLDNKINNRVDSKMFWLWVHLRVERVNISDHSSIFSPILIEVTNPKNNPIWDIRPDFY